MKKKFLIHIGSLGAGGAEKSLVSFLNTLPEELYEIDLMLLNEGGLFRNLVPKHINVIAPPFPYKCLGISPTNWRFYIKQNPKYLLKKIYSLFKLKREKGATGQILWPIWKNDIKINTQEYDVAMSYIEGLPNYYVIDKVKAKRKILWIHNEYTKLGYNKDFDKSYFDKADAIITISELCKNDLVNNFPEIKDKFQILENITNPLMIRTMAEETINDQLFDSNEQAFKILSIGRLTPQKNYPLAIDAAKILKKRGIKFKWYVLGTGPLKKELEERIVQHSLQNEFILLGLRSNPYPYMKQCDIITQSSLFEGKSIAIDEAKILNKPIVATNYKTVYDVITDGKNGLISEMSPADFANHIEELYNNSQLREQLKTNLEKENINNTGEIAKYIELING